MKRVVLILSLAAVVGLLLGAESKAMTASQAAGLQAAGQAVAWPHHPGHHGGHHGHHRRPYGPYFRGPVLLPPPVVYGPYFVPPRYYGPGGIVIGGRGWGVGIGF